MAYRDPYSTDPYGQRVPYANDFDPYADTQRKQPAYQQNSPGMSAYSGNYPSQPSFVPSPAPGGQVPQPQRQATMRSFLTSETASTRPNFKEAPPLPTHMNEKSDRASGFDEGEFSHNKEISSFSEYRSAHQANLWTKGGRGRCMGRFCCCTLMTTVFLFLSILGALVLWVRPPAVSIDNVGPPADGNTIQLHSDGITINLAVNFFVVNPNYFSVNFQKIKAEIFYPINNTPVGGGEKDNIVFNAHSSSNFTFPFSIDYESSLDPRGLILADLAQKCGVSGPKSDLTVDYKITVGIRILLVTFSPSVSNSFTFTCPLDPSDLSGLLNGSSGGSIFRELPSDDDDITL